jgi:hypothetical protein
LLDVLLNDAQRCPAATGSEVTWRPQDILPIAFLDVGSLNAEQPTGNAFAAVNKARHRAFRWIVDEQVYVLSLAVHFDQLRLEIGTNFFKHDFEPLEGVAVKYLASILCNEDQMDMQCEYAMPAVTYIVFS